MTAAGALRAVIGVVTVLALAACDPPAPPAGTPMTRPPVSVPIAPDADELAYLAHMIEHHRQALRMAAMLCGDGQVPYRIKNIADHMAATQAAEITDMTEFLNAWAKPVRVHPGGMLTEAQLSSLKVSSGPAAGRRFLELMIIHHEDAAEMSVAMLPQARNPWVISLARHVIADQRPEIATMRRVLTAGGGAAPAPGKVVRPGVA
ncbi:DUF305 domain-containing protein [Actinoplanes sp. L3-i22]|uniref:DUF305 domain-containing protein n=1 Tax=Actinoplanes sp. L3-i22 TaxID=2836373 RepID=UPI001C77F78D|nr:DUF305 domain-containing protein [Actinoplanes sp. L3-i22]BCY08519.1 hypothetical protein L3i22_036070 [Actinoplanes sp. L3-i22]